MAINIMSQNWIWYTGKLIYRFKHGLIAPLILQFSIAQINQFAIYPIHIQVLHSIQPCDYQFNWTDWIRLYLCKGDICSTEDINRPEQVGVSHHCSTYEQTNTNDCIVHMWKLLQVQNCISRAFNWKTGVIVMRYFICSMTVLCRIPSGTIVKWLMKIQAIR